jgi:hypothetical protein
VAGGQQVTFDVTADTYADLDGNGPMPAGTKINIDTDSDALDSQPLGGFAQVGSASSSTEISADGQCGHYRHVGTCPACRRAARRRSKWR